jgi:hypothetical protein
MSAKQSKPVTPPSDNDKDFADFAQIIQDNLSDLFDAVLDFQKATAVPGTNDGRPFSIRIVQVSSTWRLYIKVDSTTWKYVALS